MLAGAGFGVLPLHCAHRQLPRSQPERLQLWCRRCGPGFQPRAGGCSLLPASCSAARLVIPVPQLRVRDPATGSAGGLSGTEGNRCARISAARTRHRFRPTACRSCFSVTTSTSSSRLRSAAGCTLMFRNISLPGPTLLTVPTGKPFGKDLVATAAQHVFSRIDLLVAHHPFQNQLRHSPFPAARPAAATSPSIAPTPLLWSLIINTREVDG